MLANNSCPQGGKRKQKNLVEQLVRTLVKNEVGQEFKILSLFQNTFLWLPREGDRDCKTLCL